jgi:hypothetical protein
MLVALYNLMTIYIDCRNTQLESLNLSDNPLGIDALLNAGLGKLPALHTLRLVCTSL